MVFKEHENELETTKLELEFNKLQVDQKKAISVNQKPKWCIDKVMRNACTSHDSHGPNL
jgi:hypothetical protein